MGKRLLFLVGAIVALLCLYAVALPFSRAAYWAGLAAFAGFLVGIAGAIISRSPIAQTVLGSILGSVAVALIAYHVFDYQKFGQIHEVIWFGIVGGVFGVMFCWALGRDSRNGKSGQANQN